MDTAAYDPFAVGRFPVGARTIALRDAARGRLFPCEIWFPVSDAAPPSSGYPLVVFSHHAGGHRRSATFLGNHLASHGYVVAGLDHSEVVAKELARREGESAAERSARVDAIVGSRVPDVRFLLDHLLTSGAAITDSATADLRIDAERVGLVGHSLGGWTVLATPEVEPRVRAVVAMGPGGSDQPRPGVLHLNLTFAWTSPVPTLFLAAADDVPIPVTDVCALFERAPVPKRMFILRRADHQHFLDNVEAEHEAIRAMSFPGDAAWITAAMLPIAELSSGEQAHTFVRSLTLAHFDAAMRNLDAAERFLAGNVAAELAKRGVESIGYTGHRIV
jgi:dienelactone hydrolase